jgi:hypothetical protein
MRKSTSGTMSVRQKKAVCTRLIPTALWLNLNCLRLKNTKLNKGRRKSIRKNLIF